MGRHARHGCVWTHDREAVSDSTELFRHEEVVIRRLQPRDCVPLARFFCENNRPKVVRYFNPFPLDEEAARRITESTGRDRYYAAFCRGEVVGMCMLRGWDEGFDVPSLGVLVDHRCSGRGLGKALTEFCVSTAKREGCPAIRLSVFLSNIRALRLYKCLGFREVERQSTEIRGEQDIRVVMMKGTDR